MLPADFWLRVLLGHPEDLPHRGETRARLGPRVLAQREHAVLHRVAADLAGGCPPHDETAGLVVDPEQLVDSDAPAVAGAPALVAAPAPVQLDSGGIRDA